MPATSGAESAPPRTRLSTLGANRLESSALIRRGLSRMHTIAASVGGTPTLSVPQRIILSEGWSRRAVAFCAGACGALALEPIAFGPAMAIPLTVAVWLIDGSADSPRRAGAASLQSAASAGWWLGFG